MRLNRLFIEHFKGIEKLEVKANGNDVTVRGENGTGKTTIADAYAWALTGKGFDGTKIDGQIKLRNERGESPNDGGVEHAVEVELEDDDGQPLKISRRYVEKWEKRRGDAESEFTGNTVKYAINDVPLSKAEFEKRLAEICDETAFRLLSMPLSFCSMKWPDRRKILMSIVGNISQADVIASDPELAPLTEMLKDKTLEDLRKILAAQIKKTNAALQGIPARIDELTNMIEEPDGQPEAAIRTEYDSLRTQKMALERELIKATNGGSIAELEKKKAAAEAAVDKIKAEFEAAGRKERIKLEDQARGCNTKIMTLKDENERLSAKKEQLMAMIETATQRMDGLRSKWQDANAKQPDLEGIEICPYCGQQLPADKLEETKQQILEEFNAKKAKALMDINTTGKRIKAQQVADVKASDDIATKIAENDAEITRVQGKLAGINEELESIGKEDTQLQLGKHPGYQSAIKQMVLIAEEISNLQNDSSGEADKIQQQIDAIELDISARAEKLAAFTAAAKQKARIDELKVEEQKLGATYSQLQRDMALTDRFLETEVNMTESSINSHFEFVRWKMFDRQINGGLKQCCEPLIDGVPFGDGLNKGSRMKAALDILNTLSRHYKKSLPVIIDDCEAYTSLIPVDAQLIRLIADKKYKKLHVEVEK